MVMGKCLRSCKQQRSPPPAAAEAAAYLTLRSGRRVPAAASPWRCHRRGGGRRCGNNAASAPKSATASASAAARQLRRRRVLNSLRGREVEGQLPPSLLENSHVACSEGCGDRRETPHSGDVKHDHDGNRFAGRPSPPPEAEIEAFFAAAELAERRRFAETYNYDVALDRPFEGRYEWAPVSA